MNKIYLEIAKLTDKFRTMSYRLTTDENKINEAVQELMRDLTSGDPVVILAGYPSEMEGFLRVNPGLGRRFQVRFDFKDYDV